MQEKITFKGGRISKFAIIALTSIISLTSLQSKAQTFCTSETPIWTENFGSGTTVSSNADVINLTYQATGDLNDKNYRVANNTQQKPEWHSSLDHTGNVNGKMLVVNGDAETFYRHTITAVLAPGTYAASLYLMNVNTPGTCAPNPLLPNFTFAIEYNPSATGTTGWVSLQSVTAPAVPQTATPIWRLLGGTFTLPAVAQRVRLTLTDGTISGCGNDFAIDDVKFSNCPVGGPLPVNFSGISAAQKNTGVQVSWSTASESNNKFFDVERSTDGGVTFSKIATVNTLGNSSNTKNYGLYDPAPVAGVNYYRVKQVDNDGLFKYSSTVKVSIVIDKTVVSVLNNPFTSSLSVDFLSKPQSVNVRLSDITGKVVGTDRWSISSGRSVKTFDKAANLSRGMYILTVLDENGAAIYTTKVVKQ